MPVVPIPMRRHSLATLLLAAVLLFAGLLFATVARAQFSADDFHACALDTVWTFVDPAGDGATAIIGDGYTDNAHLSLSVPGGATHEIWNGDIGAPHVRQALVNADFTATVKFLSSPPANFGQQGLFVEQDQNLWLRLELYRDATGQLRVAAVGGPTTVFYDLPLVTAQPAPLYLRVNRAGDLWTLQWSGADRQWHAAGVPFTYAFAPTSLGLYAGNRGDAPPAHTVEVDWIDPGADGEATDDLARNTLTTSVTGGGLVTRTPDLTGYACGQDVTITAVDQPGWAFSEWTGAVTGSANPAVVTMDGPRSVTAVFAPAPVCTLTTGVSGGGSISLEPAGGVYNVGTVVTVTAHDGPGWVFDSWAGDLSGPVRTQQLLMDGDHAVTAQFSAVQQFTVAVGVSPEGAGAVSLEPPGALQNLGATVTFTAVPQPGWTFASWQGDLSGTDNPTQLTVTGDVSATAVFEPLPRYTLTTTANAGGHVARVPDEATYAAGSPVELTAVPDAGYRFTGWSGDLTGVVSPDTLVMDADKVVDAAFALIPPAFASDDFNRCELGALWTVVDPLHDGGHAEVVGGYLGDARLAISVPGGAVHEIWSGLIGATHVLQPAVDEDFVLEAKLVADLPANFGQEGLLVRGSDTSWVRSEFLRDEFGQLRAALVVGPVTVVHDVALPAGAAPPLWMRVTRSGDVFTQSWSPDGATWSVLGAPAPYAMVVSGVGVYAGNRGSAPPAHTVLVDYVSRTAGGPELEDAALAPLTVTVTGNGTVERLLDLPTYGCGQQERLTAVPVAGWAFAGWSGDVSGTANPLWVTMGGAKAVTATFTPDLSPAPLPVVTRLYPCAPNPFNPRTVVAFDLARGGPVRLRVYGVDGRLVRVLAEQDVAAGRHEYAWDGRDAQGRPCAAGAYLLRLSTPDGEMGERAVLLK